MVGFKNPVQLPKFTDEEWSKRKAEHVSKYGYTVNVPAFNDIFHTSLASTPTKSELQLFKDKNVDQLGKKRYDEIRKYQEKKRSDYLRMLESPTPEWVQNIGSALNFLDDLNDALGTLAFVMRVGARLVPKAIGRFLSGPAGWILTGAEIVGFLGNLVYTPIAPLKQKRLMHEISGSNPFTKKAALARARKLRRSWPTQGEIIEALQTTDQMFGYGISLGPIMGFAQDVAFGAWKVIQGEKVNVKLPPMDYPLWMLPLSPAVFAFQSILGGNPIIDDDTYSKAVMVAYGMSQVYRPYNESWNPLDNIEGLQNVIVPAKPITQPSTLYLLEEEGIDPKSVTGYPLLGKSEATFSELWDSSSPKINNAFHGYAQRQKNTYKGWMTAQLVNHTVHNMFGLAEGDSQMIVDYDPVEKVCHKMYDKQYVIFPKPSQAKIDRFCRWVYADPNHALSLTPQQMRTQSYDYTGLTWVPYSETLS